MTDDTQPRRPPTLDEVLQEGPPLIEPQNDDDNDDAFTAGGPGCVIWSLVILMLGIISLMIVVMAGAAGWTQGQRVAQRTVSAAELYFVETQYPAIQTDVADLNYELLATRMAFLATRTPGVPQMDVLRATETAVYLNVTATSRSVINQQLTLIPQNLAEGDRPQAEQRLAFLATQTPGVAELPALQATATAYRTSPTTTPTPLQAAPTPTPPGGFDLPTLFTQAQQEFSIGAYADAYNTLDLIRRVDPNFNRTAVEALLHQVLIAQARPLYNVNLSADPSNPGTLAEAIRLTDLAEQYGSIDDLAYERDIATLYLNAITAIDAGNHDVAIRRLQVILTYQSTYKGADLNRLLFNEYVAYGDAWALEYNWCQAEQQYQQALTLFSDPSVSGKRNNARDLCQQGQTAPTTNPNLPPNETPVAPIGVPGT
ncbi:MAG: hypothetical protein CUN56_00275 [Phototrophicales bacterium]|nr:MAG: hypothetical protein CUN56_00275 [Phototrophicales bacterium]RMG71117.1 MAG: hypothetical protein D6711_15970 [Chloroflexota bacterium]